MSSEVVITAQGLSKAYAIYSKPVDRLKQMIWRQRRKFYQEYWALRNVSLEVRKGEMVGLIGRNGSGKSTLLQMICGTLQPTVGTVSVHGRVAALLELGAGFNPEFSGRENVYLSASVLGLTKAQIDERYESIAEFAGIGDFIEQPVKMYSSGMYARLAFSVATHVDADILIIDEILAVGDAAFVQRCMRVIHQFKETGTILFVSHDTAAVTNLCDRVVWLENGEVREEGAPKEVCHDYLAAIFAEKEDPKSFSIGGRRRNPVELSREVPPEDVRHDELKESGLAGKIDIFDFDPNAPWFGQRGATITGVQLLAADAQSVAVLEGGESVRVRVSAHAECELTRPIVGFYIKDRLGQYLFGDNTYLTYREQGFRVSAGTEFSAEFLFQLPYLPSGDYSIIASVAEGNQDDHVQHHWIDDAVFFRVNTSFVARGLVGIPMLEISLNHE